MTDTATPAVDASPRAPRWTGLRIAWLVLLVGIVVYRLWLLSHWSWYLDDFAFAYHVDTWSFGHFLFQDYYGHLMPMQFLIMWVGTKLAPTNHAWATGVTATFAGAALITWTLALRELFGERLQVLLCLVVMSLTPGLCGIGLWWATGLPAYSLQTFMGLCLWLEARWLLRGHRRSDLLWMTGAYLLALLFWQKCLLITVPLFFVALIVAEGTLRARLRGALRLLWPAGGLSVIYLAGYELIARSQSLGAKSEQPVGRSVGAALRFYGHALVDIELPSLIGGPYSDLSSADASYPGTPWIVGILTVALAVTVAGLGLRYRRRAPLVLVMAAFYFALSWGLVLFNFRYSLYGLFVVRAPRYWVDSCSVTLLACVFLTTPTRGAPVEASLRRPVSPATWTFLRSALLNAFCVVTALTLVDNGRNWSAMAAATPAPWFETFRADAKSVGPATLYDTLGDPYVVGALPVPSAMLSGVLAPLHLPLKYDTPAPSLLIPDASGHLTLGVVKPGTTAVLPGPTPSCGYVVNVGQTTVIPMTGQLFPFKWTLDLSYFTGTDALVRVAISGDQVKVPLNAGTPGATAHELVVVNGGVPNVQITGISGVDAVCITAITAGTLMPSDQRPKPPHSVK